MSDRPIIMSAPMVRAMLDGRKTMTRRVLKPQPPDQSEDGLFQTSMVDLHRDGNWYAYSEQLYRVSPVPVKVPYAPGDRLWVRESWRTCVDGDPLPPREMYPELYKVWFEADRDNCDRHGRLRSPRHMPRWASRLTLEVTEVRVERLQDISEADAKAEGAMFHDGRGVGHSGWRHDFKDVHADARSSFARLWNSLHGPGAWDENPWVVVIPFTPHHVNIERMP